MEKIVVSLIITVSIKKFIRFALIVNSERIFVELFVTKKIFLPISRSRLTTSTEPSRGSFSSHKTPSQSKRTVSNEERNFFCSSFEYFERLERDIFERKWFTEIKDRLIEGLFYDLDYDLLHNYIRYRSSFKVTYTNIT